MGMMRTAERNGTIAMLLPDNIADQQPSLFCSARASDWAAIVVSLSMRSGRSATCNVIPVEIPRGPSIRETNLEAPAQGKASCLMMRVRAGMGGLLPRTGW